MYWSTIQHNTLVHYTTQHTGPLYNTTHWSTIQHNTLVHCTTQHTGPLYNTNTLVHYTTQTHWSTIQHKHTGPQHTGPLYNTNSTIHADSNLISHINSCQSDTYSLPLSISPNPFSLCLFLPSLSILSLSLQSVPIPLNSHRSSCRHTRLIIRCTHILSTVPPPPPPPPPPPHTHTHTHTP